MAVDVARRQGALFWELRVAVDLAECSAAGDAGCEAATQLESALRATEGCSTQPEHQRALRLLAGAGRLNCSTAQVDQQETLLRT